MELRSGEAIYPGIPWGGLGREEDEEEWRSSVESEDEEQLSRWNWVGRGGLGAGALPRVKWHNWATS